MKVTLAKNNLVYSEMEQARTITIWTPSQITTVGWWDASDTSTIAISTVNTLDYITQWDDKSGNDYHMTSTFIITSHPTTNTRTINSLNAAVFNDQLIYHSISAAQLFPTNQIINLFYVVDIDLDAASNVFFMAKSNLPPIGSDATNFRGGAPSTTANVLNANLLIQSTAGAFPGWMYNVFNDGIRNNNQFAAGDSILNVATSPFIGVTQFDRSSTSNISISSWMNGGAAFQTFSSLSGAAQNVATAVILGSNGVYPANAAQKLNGVMGEVIITHGNLSTDARTKVEGYLAWKWNTVSTLLSSHPYKNRPPLI